MDAAGCRGRPLAAITDKEKPNGIRTRRGTSNGRRCARSVRITIPQAFAVFTKGKKIYDAYKASDKSTAAALAAAGDMLKMLTDEGVTLADLSAILTIVGPFLGAIKK
jgi:hypothetical protein